MFYTLYKNSKPQEIGGPEVVDAFEDSIVTWNSETSGWDKDGNYLVIRVRPPLTRIVS